MHSAHMELLSSKIEREREDGRGKERRRSEAGEHECIMDECLDEWREEGKKEGEMDARMNGWTQNESTRGRKINGGRRRGREKQGDRRRIFMQLLLVRREEKKGRGERGTRELAIFTYFLSCVFSSFLFSSFHFSFRVGAVHFPFSLSLLCSCNHSAHHPRPRHPPPPCDDRRFELLSSLFDGIQSDNL